MLVHNYYIFAELLWCVLASAFFFIFPSSANNGDWNFYSAPPPSKSFLRPWSMLIFSKIFHRRDMNYNLQSNSEPNLGSFASMEVNVFPTYVLKCGYVTTKVFKPSRKVLQSDPKRFPYRQWKKHVSNLGLITIPLWFF